MRFTKFHDLDGDPVWINLDHVITVQEVEALTEMTTIDGSITTVRERLEEVKAKLIYR